MANPPSDGEEGRRPEGDGFRWVLVCDRESCRARRAADGGTEGRVALRKLVRHLPRTVLVSSQCLGDCEQAPIVVIDERAGPSARALLRCPGRSLDEVDLLCARLLDPRLPQVVT